MDLIDEAAQEDTDELGMLIFLFAGQVCRGASADEAIRHIAEYGELLAPQMAAQIGTEAGPKASFFRILARAMWNNLPQPAHGFRLVKLLEPGRNDACFCGSLHKYKHCCARMPQFPMEPAVMLDGLLKAMPRKRWAELAGSAVDRSTVEHLAFIWRNDENHENIAALLEPWFKGEDAIKSSDAELLDMLLEAYVALDKPRKRKSLAQAAIERGEPTARSIGWQRIALMEADKGNWAAAQKAQIEAQRADPDNLNHGLLEVHLLISAGNAALAQERAKYWALRLARLNDPALQDQIGWLRDVVLNPQAAMMQITRHGDAAIRELEVILQGAPQLACHYNLKPSDGSTGPFRPDAELRKALKEWEAEFPSMPPSLVETTTWNEEAWDYPGAWLALLRENPILLNCFTVLDDLVIALDGYGQPWASETLIPPLLERAVALFDLVREKHGAGKSNSEWSFLGNRPPLRLLVRQAVDWAGSSVPDEREAAFALMRRLVEVVNPNDNHGFRAFVVAGLLERGLIAEANTIADRYPNDLADMQYTRALALHLAGREDEACKVARFALGEWPRVGKCLLAESPRQPRDNGQFGYAVGSNEEAWQYREEFRAAWEKLGGLTWLAGLARKKQ